MLTRNFSCKSGEIDLVMVDTDGSIVFVEVKTRAGEEFEPVESVMTFAKKNRMSRAARYFISSNNIEEKPFRLDFVAIVLGRAGREQIRHYESVFVP